MSNTFGTWTHKGEAASDAAAEYVALGRPLLRGYAMVRGPKRKEHAAVIAAAPELLDFAEVAGGFIAWAKDNGADPAAMDGLEKMRRAAIAKAKGE